ncbi:MAG: zf-HC2 domain-containing protein [Armatimonadota bacterium]|nr:MAG: zf-HC2 domain-containing protein [Armatimonadota bacterium]
MYCVRSSEELTSFMDGELSSGRAAEIERHLTECAACRRALSQLRQTASLVGALAEVEPPADLRARIAQKAAQPQPAALACAGARELLDEYAHGELGDEAANSVHAHLCECEACGRELAQLEQGAGLLGSLADVAPPPRIRERVQREVALRSRPVYAKPTFRGLVATLATAATAAAVMVAMRVPASAPQSVRLAEQPRTAPEATVAEPSTTRTAPMVAEEVVKPAQEQVARAVAGLARSRPTAATSVATTAQPAATLMASVALDGTPASATEPKPVAPAGEPDDPPLMVAYVDGDEMTRFVADGALLPIATPAPQPAGAGPVVGLEPATTPESLPQPHPTRETVRATVTPKVESPFAEVRRALKSDRKSEAPTFRRKRQQDRLAAGPISPWGF